MKGIIARIGWPTRSKVGYDGARAAWLLVQHADLDPAFQRTCLDLIRTLKDADRIRPADLAYLTDRVLVNEGKPQEFGTQFHTVEGRLQPRPIREPDQVDKRRETMGLSTLQEYTELMHR